MGDTDEIIAGLRARGWRIMFGGLGYGAEPEYLVTTPRGLCVGGMYSRTIRELDERGWFRDADRTVGPAAEGD